MSKERDLKEYLSVFANTHLRQVLKSHSRLFDGSQAVINSLTIDFSKVLLKHPQRDQLPSN
jgi:hypothetical protein